MSLMNRRFSTPPLEEILRFRPNFRDYLHEIWRLFRDQPPPDALLYDKSMGERVSVVEGDRVKPGHPRPPADGRNDCRLTGQFDFLLDTSVEQRTDDRF